jgi:hypothetical protein
MLWFWMGVAPVLANDAPPSMWDRCVSEDRLSAMGLQEVRETMAAHPPGSSGKLTALDTLLESYGDCPALYMQRAGVYHGKGRPDMALLDLKKAAAIGPDWPEVQRALAVALHRSDDGAGEVLDTAIALNPDDGLLKIYQAAERAPSERPDLLKAAVSAHPDDADVAVAAVDALVEAGRPLEAVALARERQLHLDDPRLAERIGTLDRPFDDEEEIRIRRPAEFRTLEDGTEEVIVYSPEKARKQLENRLAQLGWTEAKPIGGGVRYKTDKPVQPWVEIYDDGRVVVQKKGFVGTPQGTLQPGQSMIPVVSERKLRKKRTKLMEDIWYEVTEWRQARIRVAFQEQLGERLPDQLTAVWEDGVPMYGEGSLDNAVARRKELLDYWATRACSPDGEAARDVVRTFIARVVQESPHPATGPEIQAAERKCACEGASLGLDAEGADGVE